MGKQITGRARGYPDFYDDYVNRNLKVSISGVNYFNEALVKNATEQENVPGLVTNKVVITGITVRANQPLKYRLHFYWSSSFGSADMNEDSKVASIDLDMPRYSSVVRKIIS